ncbi:MAG: (5-formylfuran-3-yl)methyl phosphate synthase [Candidatus Nitrospinota bacterium M3_3B_026]
MSLKFIASVISAKEAEVVLEIADVLDVKDPSKGALGAADPQIVADVRAVAPDLKISAALGEAEGRGRGAAALAAAMAEAGADIVKISVACAEPKRALSTLLEVRKALSYGASLVAVTYADSPSGLFIKPFDLPFLASAAGADGVMIDTKVKDGSCLLDHVTEYDLARIVSEARELGLFTAFGGSLGAGSVPAAARAGADYIGFRSAIASAGRAGEGIDAGKALAISLALKSFSAETAGAKGLA